jgi:hypothetical protein
MDASTAVTVLSLTVVVGTLVLTGPLVGGYDASTAATELGEGTATVETARLADSLSFSPGRFGTGVVYLRVPDAAVEFSSATGRSRLVYRVAVPALGFDRVGTAPVDSGTTDRRVGMGDRAFAPDSLDRGRYRVNVTVRVQSFAVDRTVLRRNVTVEAGDG